LFLIKIISLKLIILFFLKKNKDVRKVKIGKEIKNIYLTTSLYVE